jgi:hypothetical protein
MVSEFVEGYLREPIELGAGDPILFEKKNVIFVIALERSPLKRKEELEFVTDNNSSMPEFYFPIVHK